MHLLANCSLKYHYELITFDCQQFRNHLEECFGSRNFYSWTSGESITLPRYSHRYRFHKELRGHCTHDDFTCKKRNYCTWWSLVSDKLRSWAYPVLSAKFCQWELFLPFIQDPGNDVTGGIF